MPKRDVIAGAWVVNTEKGSPKDCFNALVLDDKLDMMTKAVNAFWTHAQAAANSSGTDPLFVFAAPEYFFKRSGTQPALSKDERDKFVTAMKMLAGSKKNLLLIPGTILRRKAMDAKARAKAEQRLQSRGPMFKQNRPFPEAPYTGIKNYFFTGWQQEKARALTSIEKTSKTQQESDTRTANYRATKDIPKASLFDRVQGPRGGTILMGMHYVDT